MTNRASQEGALRRARWRLAEVLEIIRETPRTKSVLLRVPDWPGHLPGQHVDVRLVASDGDRAQRSYSIASPPEQETLMLTIERLEEGEVSSYLADELRRGDWLELRGPIGDHFVWTVDTGGPLLLLAGGSGIVPLMAMLRHRAGSRSAVPACLVYSARSYEEIIYREEIGRLAQSGDALRVVQTLTRSQPPGWTGPRRRIDREMLQAAAPAPEDRPHVFLCGPEAMVEAVAATVVELGHDPARVKTERFGPTGIS
jgi:ferredoxin-NADP reductase